MYGAAGPAVNRRRAPGATDGNGRRLPRLDRGRRRGYSANSAVLPLPKRPARRGAVPNGTRTA